MLFPVFGLVEGITVLHEWKDISLYFKILQIIGAIVILISLSIILLVPDKKERELDESKQRLLDEESKDKSMRSFANQEGSDVY
jgi:hypothetical protein